MKWRERVRSTDTSATCNNSYNTFQIEKIDGLLFAEIDKRLWHLGFSGAK